MRLHRNLSFGFSTNAKRSEFSGTGSFNNCFLTLIFIFVHRGIKFYEKTKFKKKLMLLSGSSAYIVSL